MNLFEVFFLSFLMHNIGLDFVKNCEVVLGQIGIWNEMISVRLASEGISA
jgi:hypothetical protein